MTRAELAAATRVSVHTIQRAEEGLPIAEASRQRLARVLGPGTYECVAVWTRADSRPELPDDAPAAMVARYSRDLSLKDAARQMGISHHTLMRAERGEVIQMRTARIIAGFYDLAVDDVFVIPDQDHDDAAVA